MIVVRSGMSVLTVCEQGYGKRTPIDEYRLTKRGGKGVINIRATERNGPVLALRGVTDEDSLILITANGILMRMDLGELREIGRATQGVRLIRVDSGDRVVAVAKIVTEREEREVDEAAVGSDSTSRAGADETEQAVEDAESEDEEEDTSTGD
jgi:DNA gyrase subunit A